MTIAGPRIRVKKQKTETPTSDSYTLDPDDASRLSFLAYTIEHYSDIVSTGAIKSIVDGLKAPEAHQIADALRGNGGSDPRAKEAASVFRGWIRKNATAR